ncbi:MAG: hypothetical protein FJZ95_10060 [Chloroflexi bacterium]|nr:hypothetical protein [Chloroflexota bacterium]
MSVVRLNITLPEDLVKQLEALAGSRKKSLFIVEALRERIEQIEKEKLSHLLEEGYKASQTEALALAKEFEPVDLEGWDDY